MSKKVILHNSDQFQFQIQLFTVENLFSFSDIFFNKIIENCWMN